METRGINDGAGVDPLFRDLTGDSKPSMLLFSITFMLHSDNLAVRRAGILPGKRDIVAHIPSKRQS